MRKTKTSINGFWRVLLFVSLAFALSLSSGNAFAQPKKAPSRANKYSSLPSGYSQVGTTELYYKQTSTSIDVIGKYDGYYYSSTFGDNGYGVAMQVNDNYAISVDCLNGSTNDGVTFQASIIPQGDLARVCYTITNSNDSDVTVSLGTHADVMIGSNDRAPIMRRTDTFGQTYGLTMMDGEGAQLCVLFGSGLAGVTPVSDFWFGYYSQNRSASEMVGNYNEGSYYMEENGSYDSGMGWCWKKHTMAAGSTYTFSYLIGVGEVSLEPNSTFEVTPDDPEGWNDLSRPHRLTLNGSYDSPAGLEGFIDYAVEDSEDWTTLTDTLASGDEFTASLVATFDATKSTHTIKFRTRDLVGNTTMLHPIEYADVSFHELTGIEDKVYTGDSLLQQSLTCDLDEEQYVLKAYRNNVNAGTASFNLEGVFPYTIGRKTYTFTIAPQPITGGIVLEDSVLVYNGEPLMPAWSFAEEAYASLNDSLDYDVMWTDNTLPGTALLMVSGKNNYTDTLIVKFYIDKAQIADTLYSFALPSADITYDGQSHGATVNMADGVGEATFHYLKQGETETTTTPPTEAGDYTVYVEFADGTLYYGQERMQVGEFAIYEFSSDEWTVLQQVLPQLTEMGWSQPWDVSMGMKGVSSLHGLTIEKGHVTGLDLSAQNLTGTFPCFLLALPHLQRLDLSGNNLTGDVAEAVSAFVQDNPASVANVGGIDISGNQLSGNIGQFAGCFTNLTSLNASDNQLEAVSPMISPTVTNLELSRQAIGRVVPVSLADLCSEPVATTVPSILLYDHANQTFLHSIDMLCVTPDSSWAMVLSCQDESFTMPYASASGTYYGESGDTLLVAVIGSDGSYGGNTFRMSLGFDGGDSNFDGMVNILDLQASVTYMMEKYQNRPFNFTAANLWEDETVNVQDIICLVNLLLNDETDKTKSASAPRRAAQAPTIGSDAAVYVENGQIMINTSQPVAAFDITLRGANSINIASLSGMTICTKARRDGLRIIGYSLNGTCIPAGISTVGTLGQTATVGHAMLSDCEANAISVSCDNTVTGIEPTIVSPDGSGIYDLQGRKVNAMHQKGIYIQNGCKVVK